MQEVYDTKWKGFYFDGRSANRQQVTIIVMPDGLYILREDGSTLRWHYDQIRQTQGFHSKEQIRLERGEDVSEALVVADETFLKAIHQVVPGFSKRFQSPIRKSALFKIALLAAIGVIIVASFLYLWGIPTLADTAASHIPVSWEEKLGRTYIGSLAPPEKQCNDPERQKMLEQLLSTLTATLPQSPYTFRLTIVRGNIVNAFAMPGGYIVVNEALLEKTKTPEELAGILAHEIQHIVHHHGTKALFRKLSLSVLITAMTGDAQGMSYALESAGTLGSLRYGRGDEETADREGMKMIQKAHINPVGMVNAFRMLEKEVGDVSKGLQYLSTHPRTEDRIKVLKKLAANKDYEPIKLLSDHSWEDVQKICDAE